VFEHGCMDAWMHGFAACLSMDAWMHGCMDAWMHGFAACLSMDAWMHLGV